MTPENGTFRCSIDIPDGEHEYKYRVRRTDGDNWTDVIDPYVKKYDPTRNTGLINIKNGKQQMDEFIWKYDDTKLPDNKNLIIYEMYVADFSDNGQFSGIIGKLDYLSDLGINAIELMPIQESMGLAHDWGYSTRHFFALKPTYGTSTDLKQFVDECHRRGIRVFLDGVFNHTAGDCPLAVIDHDYWYYKDKHHPEDPFYWGPEFNFEYYDEKQNMKPACKYINDVVCYWIGEFHLDGIRFDAAKQMDNYDILHELDSAGRSARSSQPFYSQAEYVPETPTIVKANGGPVDACWSSSFHGIVAEVLANPSNFNLDQVKYMISASSVINYLSCHDNERLLFLLGKNGNIFDNEAFRRMRLAAVLLITSVGVPLIPQGDEYGEARELGTDDPNKKKLPMQWDLLNNQRNRSLFDTFKRLLELLNPTYDSGSLGLNGTGVNIAVVDGRINQAMRFSGSSSYFYAYGVYSGKSFSVSLWVNPSSIATCTVVQTSYGLYNYACHNLLGFYSTTGSTMQILVQGYY
ncbi:unnamed protein product [Rotaria sordida]|uniref:Alpha-amylase n=1 Tax=Rotaria sordida TaxID=392033 RepID=A0A814FIZ7_9BILA|nr:unnamed protein product [Rotaria sordida]CAF1056561.1 unnamed protein product [Rotaria sordida]